MKNKSRKIVSVILIFIITVLIFQTKSFAATASANISAGSTTIKAGDTTTISASVSNAEAYSLTMKASGGNLSGTTEKADAPGEEVSQTVLSASFSADTPGTYTITLTGQATSTEQTSNDQKTNISKSITINVEAKEENKNNNNNNNNNENNNNNNDNNNDSQDDPNKNEVPREVINENHEEPKSSNNSLKSLSISEGTLTPEFNRATTSYEVEFADDFDINALTSISVSAEKEDSKAKISGTGSYDLVEGENNLYVTVTAENGSQKTYTIKLNKVHKIEQSDLRISTLEVNMIDEDNNFIKATLDKDFDPETFEYTLDVEKNIKALDVDAKVEREGIIIKIDGTENLKAGENTVTITLTSEKDENIKTVYEIKVNKEKEEEEENTVLTSNKEKKSFSLNYKTLIIGFAALIGVLFIVLIILIIINKKKKNVKPQDEEFIDEEDAKAYWSKKINEADSKDEIDEEQGDSKTDDTEDNDKEERFEFNKDASDEEEQSNWNKNTEEKDDWRTSTDSESQDSFGKTENIATWVDDEEFEEEKLKKKKGKHKGKHF